MSITPAIDVIEYSSERRATTEVDPITVEVIGGALDGIALEMGHKLARMSHSSIIRESEDFGAALLDATGRQICECALSTPLQLGPIPGYMRGILQLFEERGDEFRPGDVVIHNSPYHGASHAPDVAFCTPIFLSDQLVGFSFTTAHHLDIGSMTPGSVGIVHAVDAFAEGLQFKAIKVSDGGVRNDNVWRLLRDNVRASDMVIGDMEAQIAACELGGRRYVELLRKYGRDVVEASCRQHAGYSERMMRNEIAALPDGTYKAEGFIDGFADDPARRDQRICVTVTVSGSSLTVDLTGTSDQVSDRAINMPFRGTTDIAIYVTLRSILLDSETHDYVPQNEGLLRPIKIVAPRGSLANPVFPCATIARHAAGNILASTLMHALAPVCPERVSAGVGTLNAVVYSGLRDQQHWVYIDITEGSYGGMAGKDGIDAVDTLYANTRNNPIEDIEAHYPLRCLRYELRTDDSGGGEWRGGKGAIREFEFLDDVHISLEGDGHRHPPWGLFGGAPGSTASITYIRADGASAHLPGRLQSHSAGPGDRIRIEDPCAGGYGDPLVRDPQRVLDDYVDGFTSLDATRDIYGVVIDADVALVDAAATEQLREKLSAKNSPAVSKRREASRA